MMTHTALLDGPRSDALPMPPARRRFPQASSGTPPPPDRGAPRPPGEASRPRPPQYGPTLAGVDVLVIDDDPDSLEYFAMALRTRGASVVTATGAMEGLRLVEERRPDVVLSDIAMVGQDGYWLVGEIRRLADDALRRVPVIATTAYGREHSRQRTLTAGFTDHLAKPVDPDVLCRAIGNAAGR
jgi:CheY-like chemotaxis protein